MAELENFYNEHASQARQHEDHRERVTNIILSINGALIAFITFSNLSISSLWASLSIVFLGVYGFFFAGKHYERFRYHTSIMGVIRKEIDRLYKDPGAIKRSLKDLRDEGEKNHYDTFTWPSFGSQVKAISWIARQRVHVFWELIHILLIFIGLGLSATILIKKMDKTVEKPIQIRIVK